MNYRETEPAASLRREQTKVLGLPTSHLALAAIGIGLLDMIARDSSLLGIAILGMATAVAYNQFKKIRRWKLWSQGLLLGTATLLATAWLGNFGHKGCC